jgi:hypothetical protein
VPREPAAWLATIARNECWARVRARMREPLATADVDEAHGLPDPLAEAIRRADLAALWAAIEELPRQQRDALLLREFGGLSYEELAEALAVTTPAVESLLFRARRQLRERLEAAYAALGGAGWVQALARLFAGSAPAAATKAVALGLGAAAVTSGAVVAPRVFEHQAHHARTPARTTSVPAAGAVAGAAPVAARIQRAVVRTSETRRAAEHVFRARDGGRRDGSDESRDSGSTEVSDRTETSVAGEREHSSGEGGDGGGTATTSTSTATSHDGGSAVAEPRDGGDGGATTTAAQPSDQTSGQDGGGDTPSSGSGDSVTTTTPLVTVTVPPGDLSGGDG